jgi:hypothetical protein
LNEQATIAHTSGSQNEITSLVTHIQDIKCRIDITVKLAQASLRF